MTHYRNALDRYIKPSQWRAIRASREAHQDGVIHYRRKLASAHERSPPL